MDKRIQQVVALMNAHIGRKLSLAELASAAGVSPAHLCYLFKSQTAMTPYQYFMKLKMEKAQQLLSSTSLSIKHVMIEVGFTNASLFVRNFKKAYGMAPSRYRADFHAKNPNQQINDKS